jgi:hypothetical protein
VARIRRKDIATLVDLLAHEYGWSIEYIERLKIDEIRDLQRAIAVRRQFEFKTLAYVVNCAMRGKMPKFDASDTEIDDEVYETTDNNRTPEEFRHLMRSVGGIVREGNTDGTEAKGTDS